ncbi:VanZ family protein [Candidatus Sulfidibacterium hydrothermale]|uniref:VanZ family protein n=1 Tax=Candidatus Sulfidibacterium hydrothermale TaxID=2875962 RepID=UPI001F0A7555|nr:VanZ family protein [Candidatus Sulfidibacterium hydrothermale]UBM62908.1 VanZ family protein [Candidatus Sulfidibacterium hydrothermale]
MLKKLWPSLLWSIVILLLTGLPGNYFPKVTTFWDWLEPDKAVHLFIFGVLSFLILFGYREQYFNREKRYIFGIVAVVVAALYGLITELLQYYVFTGRDGNRFDFFADAAGAVIGWLVFSYLYRKKIKHHTNEIEEFN